MKQEIERDFFFFFSLTSFVFLRCKLVMELRIINGKT